MEAAGSSKMFVPSAKYVASHPRRHSHCSENLKSLIQILFHITFKLIHHLNKHDTQGILVVNEYHLNYVEKSLSLLLSCGFMSSSFFDNELPNEILYEGLI
jgi:hypothetical protein